MSIFRVYVDGQICKRSSKTYFVPLSRKYRKRCKYAVFYTMTKGQKKSYQQD